jgi:hypothetical protein
MGMNDVTAAKPIARDHRRQGGFRAIRLKTGLKLSLDYARQRGSSLLWDFGGFP